MFPRLLLNSGAQAVLPSQPTELGLQVYTTMPSLPKFLKMLVFRKSHHVHELEVFQDLLAPFLPHQLAS